VNMVMMPRPAELESGVSMGQGNPNQPAGTNMWDFMRALSVLATLAGITVFLVLHYKAENNVAGVLGIVAPVLAAVVGVSLGYATGSQTGKAQGEAGKADAVKQSRKALATHLRDLVDVSGAEDAAANTAAIAQVRSALGVVETE
jgi:hypothetical protein